jgi:sugar-specific transcriptional regulator TrmB
MELAIEKLAYNKNIDRPRDTKSRYLQDFSDDRLSTIEQTLEGFGLLKNEVRIYLSLADAEPIRAKDICDMIKIHRTETYRILHHLEKKGLVYSVLGKPLKFAAVPLDQAIDILVETQKTKIQMLQNQKEELVDLWSSIPKKRLEAPTKELFQKLEGEQQIILKANEVLDKTQKQLQLFVGDEYIAELYYGNFFDKLKSMRKLDITLVTVASQRSQYFLEKIKLPKEKIKIVQNQSTPCFLISDKRELIVAFDEEVPSDDFGHKKKGKNVAIWTNYGAVVSIFGTLFSKLDMTA